MFFKYFSVDTDTIEDTEL